MADPALATRVALRPPTPADAALYYRVLELTMREHVVATWGQWDEDRVRRETAAELASPHAHVIVVDGIDAGVLLVEHLASHVQLGQLFILPAHQGQGVGRHLVENLVAEATRAGLPVRLRVLRVNPARMFYEKLGFVVVESTPERFFMERAPS
jgi:GNAT superfamily N-acetyltransferase